MPNEEVIKLNQCFEQAQNTSPAVCCCGVLCAVGRWRCAVGCVLCCAVVCCCVLCCAFRRGVRLRCAVLSLLWLAVSFWSRCSVLCCASWCCVGPCRVVLCCVVLCLCALCCGGGTVLRCLGVSRSVVPLPAMACPRVLCGAPGAVCFAACSAVLLCFLLCLGVWCFGALCCAVRVVSCCLVGVCVPVWCAVSLGAVVLWVASCCFVRCCAVAHCAVCVVLCCFCSHFLVLLRAVHCPRVLFLRCGLLCRLVRCFAVLPRAVRAALCVFCRCVVVCAVFAAVRCTAGALWCYLRAFSKPEKKTASYFQKQKKLFPAGLPCVSCPPCMQQYHTLKKLACFIYLILGPGLVCTAGLCLESCGCVLAVFDTVHLQRKGGQTRQGWGSSGRKRYRDKKQGREAASAVLRAARDVVIFDYSARTATRGTSLCSYVYYSAYSVNYSPN